MVCGEHYSVTGVLRRYASNRNITERVISERAVTSDWIDVSIKT